MRSQMSADDYLAWEREQLDRHEFHHGEVFAMAGGSPRHSFLAGSLISVMTRALDRTCFTFTSDQRVAFDDGKRFVYPDVTVVCGSLVMLPPTSDVVANPTVLIEIMSASTESYDRGLKWEGYQRLASLTDYILVAQREVRVEHFQRRAPVGWHYQAYGPGESLVLTNGARLDIDACYAQAFELPGD